MGALQDASTVFDMAYEDGETDLPYPPQAHRLGWSQDNAVEGWPDAPRRPLMMPDSDVEWFRAAFKERGISPLPYDVHGFQTLAQVALYHAVLTYAVRLWRHLSGQAGDPNAGPKSHAQSAAPSLKDWPLFSGGWGHEFLADFLNPSLTPFHVRLDSGRARQPWDLPNVYQAMCLQLANHIAESVEYRHCRAEGCGRLFVRQQGRAKQEQHRVRGVLYFCSDTCANRQHQLESRRRKAAEKRRAGGTMSPGTSTEGSTP
jgi:hypothetical protein